MSEAILQVISIYFFYVGITLVTTFFVYIKIKKRVIKKMFFLVLLIPFFLYIPTEMNTFLYGREFKNVHTDNPCEIPIVYYKVLSIDKNKARILCIQGKNSNHKIANVYQFVKRNKEWKFNKWESTVWTNFGGNASEFTIPPYF